MVNVWRPGLGAVNPLPQSVSETATVCASAGLEPVDAMTVPAITIGTATTATGTTHAGFGARLRAVSSGTPAPPLAPPSGAAGTGFPAASAAFAGRCVTHTPRRKRVITTAPYVP